MADNGEARRIGDGELAVALIVLAGDQHLQRRLQMHLVRRRGVMHFAVGDRNGAGHAVRRHIGQRVVERGEEFGAVVLAAIVGADDGLAHFEGLVAS